MPPLPEAILLVLAPFALLFSQRVWGHAQVLLLGAILAPRGRTVTAALRVMGVALERHFTNYHRVLNRATWSARQGSCMLLGLLLTVLVPAEATIALGADDTVERRSGRQIQAKGCYRDAVRSTHKHVVRCFGLKWVSMMLLVPVPWSRRVWALPFLTALCWPAGKVTRRRHKTSVDWVRQMMKQVRRWLPGRRLVLVVDGGFAAVSLALACVKNRVSMVSRLRWDAALYHPPEPQPKGKRGRTPLKGKRQRSLQAWAERSDTPWEKLRMEAFFCTDLKAPPAQILQWVVMRWAVEVTFEEARAHLGFETQRQWSAKAIARTSPVLLGLFSLVTVLALRLSQGGQLPVQVTAWYHKAEPTFTDCLALVRRHLWGARYFVNSPEEPEFVQFPREAFECLLTGLSVAA
jgi:hypothetical protein